MILESITQHVNLVVDGLMLFYFLFDYSYLVSPSDADQNKKSQQKSKRSTHNNFERSVDYKDVA